MRFSSDDRNRQHVCLTQWCPLGDVRIILFLAFQSSMTPFTKSLCTISGVAFLYRVFFNNESLLCICALDATEKKNEVKSTSSKVW